jgi:hypothetical protein
MANTYATVKNGRGGTVRVGGRSGVQEAHIRGWNVGVRIEPTSSAGVAFRVIMTAGSNSPAGGTIIGHVIISDGEREFIPWPEPLPH